MPSLVKVLGEKQTSTPAARGSSGRYKDEIDGELLVSDASHNISLCP